MNTAEPTNVKSLHAVRYTLPCMFMIAVAIALAPSVINAAGRLYSSAATQSAHTGLVHGIPNHRNGIPEPARAEKCFQQIGIRFQENLGQITDENGTPRPDILFIANVPGARLYFRRDGISTVYTKGNETQADTEKSDPVSILEKSREAKPALQYRLDMTLAGCRQNSRLRGEDAYSGVVNYYLAHCPNGILGIREYGRVVYENVYDNIDFELFSSAGKLKYNFIVHPGGNVSDIRMEYTGATDIAHMADGTLRITTPLGGMEEAAPATFEGEDETLIASRFLLAGNVISFDVGAYDQDEILTIDPWSTYFGGSGYEYMSGMAMDGGGNIIVAGNTGSSNLPVLNPHQPLLSGGLDAFVAKFDGNGNRLWATYYGGSSDETDVTVAVDANGNSIVTGSTVSTNFPVSGGAFQSSNAGGTDVFVVKLGAGGTRQWATYFGGNSLDRGLCVEADGSGNIIVGGYLKSSNFPVYNALQPTKGAADDAFVFKLGSDGSRIWCTYYGGSGDDVFCGLDTDGSDNIFLVGFTRRSGFPILNAFQPVFGGGTPGFGDLLDGVVVKLSSSGARLFSSYCGGAADDALWSVVVDPGGSALVVGRSNSANFPVKNPSQANRKGGYDGIFAYISAAGNLTWATYFGGSSDDYTGWLALDGSGGFYGGGYSSSLDLPASGGLQTTNAGGNDAIIARFDGNGALQWCSYYGGTLDEFGFHGAIDNAGDIYLSGQTYSLDFPVTPGAFQTSYGGGTGDGYIVKYGCIAPAVLLHPIDRTCCADSSVHFSAASNGFPAPKIQWQVSTNGGTNWNDIAGANDTGLAITPSTVFNNYRYRAVFTNFCGDEFTAVATLTVEQPPAITLSPVDVTICAGDTAVFPVAATGSGLQYRWELDQGWGFTEVYDLPPYKGTATASLTVTPVTIGMDGFRYRCIVTGSCAPTTVSAEAQLLITPSPSIMTHPVDRAVCEGYDSSFAVMATGQDLRFRWQVDRGSGFEDVPNTIPYADVTSATLGLRGITMSLNGFRYRCIVSGSCLPADTSVAAQLAVSAVPRAAVTASGPTTICLGDRLVLRADSGAGWMYQWQRDGVDINAARNSAYQPTQSGAYRVIVSNAAGCADSSDAVLVSVRPRPVATIIADGPTSYCAGGSVGLRTSGDPDLRYTWMRDGVVIPGADALLFTATDAGLYRVALTNSSGCTDTSAGMLVRVLPAPSARIVGPPSLCPNTEATYRVDRPAGLTLSWSVMGGTAQTSPDGDSVRILWPAAGMGTVLVRMTATNGCRKDTALTVRIENALSPEIFADKSPALCEGDTLTLDAGAGYVDYLWSSGEITQTIIVRGAGSYSVTVRDANGCSGTSQPFVVSLKPSPVPTILASGNTAFCPGGSVVLDAGAMYAAFLWSNGATSQTITASSAGSFTVTVIDTSGCSGTSQPIAVTVLSRPDALLGGSTSVCMNTDAGFSVSSATGTGFAWSSTRGVLTSGAGTAQVTMRWTEAGTDTVRVTVTNAEGCTRDTSLFVSVSTSLQPVISMDRDPRICEGESVTLDAGAGYASYQWSSGESTRSIVVSAAGSYSVSVTDAAGCAGTSPPITVIVLPRPVPVIGGATELCEGESVTLDAGAGYASYLWSNGMDSRNIVVSTPGSYRVTVTDANGCSGEAEAVVVVHPRPVPVISAQGADLVSSSATTYRWQRDGADIAGATARSFTPADSGAYTVTVTDAFGCEGVSAPYVFVPQQFVTATAVIGFDCPASTPVPAGSIVSLPLRLESSAQLDAVQAHAFTLQLRFDRSVLIPQLQPAASRIEGSERIITVRGTRAASMSEGPLLALSFMAVLGEQPCTPVRIDTLTWENADVRTQLGAADCEICVEICREGGERLFRTTGRLSLRQNRPNPFNATTLLEYELIETGPTELTVQDLMGRRVATVVSGTLEAGRYIVPFDASGLSSGTYLYLLRTPSASIFKLMEVVK